jgi:hypothetical protein
MRGNKKPAEAGFSKTIPTPVGGLMAMVDRP